MQPTISVDAVEDFRDESGRDVSRIVLSYTFLPTVFVTIRLPLPPRFNFVITFGRVECESEAAEAVKLQPRLIQSEHADEPTAFLVTLVLRYSSEVQYSYSTVQYKYVQYTYSSIQNNALLH